MEVFADVPEKNPLPDPSGTLKPNVTGVESVVFSPIPANELLDPNTGAGDAFLAAAARNENPDFGVSCGPSASPFCCAVDFSATGVVVVLDEVESGVPKTEVLLWFPNPPKTKAPDDLLVADKEPKTLFGAGVEVAVGAVVEVGAGDANEKPELEKTFVVVDAGFVLFGVQIGSDSSAVCSLAGPRIEDLGGETTDTLVFGVTGGSDFGGRD